MNSVLNSFHSWTKLCNVCDKGFLDPFNDYEYCPRCGTRLEKTQEGLKQ